MDGASSITQSKNVSLFGSVPFHGSCSLKTKRRRSDMCLSSKKSKSDEESLVWHKQVNFIRIDSDEERDQEWSKFSKGYDDDVIWIDTDEEGDQEELKFSKACVEQVENVVGDADDVICLDSDEEGDKEELNFSDKKFSKACVEQVEIVDNADADKVGDEEWLGYPNKNKFEVDGINIQNEEQSGDIVGEGGLEEYYNDDEEDEFDDGEESEEIETSDEEFLVDNVNDVFESDDSRGGGGGGDDDVQSVRGLRVGVESDSIKPKQKKMIERKESDYKGRASSSSGEKKESMELRLNQRGKSTVFLPKELRLIELLAGYYWGNKNSRIQNDSPVLEMKDVIRRDTRSPPVCTETAPLIWSLKKAEKVQKTKSEKEEEVLWDKMETSLRELEAESMMGNLGTNKAVKEKMESSSSECDHDIRLDEEIGVYCRRCGWVVTDIKDVSPQVVDKFPYEGSGQRVSFGDANVSHFHDSYFNVFNNDLGTNFSYDERTVWDLIPDVKQTLYSHQQEGFEFIWNKLVGNIELQGLKNANLQREGGCIISHAPGTGKTKLTIMFLKAYLKVFPKCLPVIVAPAGLLLTWEEEFKKWDIGVPFHNLKNPELSVKELDDVVNATNWSNSQWHSTDETRMAKLISWFKETSILGISYSLFKKLAGGEGALQKRKENSYMRKALLEAPGLLVLDEGHTPRNARSRVWKVLSKIQTKKRIMLSGTPFQNNFLELYNTFSIVKPSFPNTIPHKLKKFCQKHKKAAKEWSWEPVAENSTTGNSTDDKIKHLKLLMDPFVHVYKGAILQKKIPGLRDCVLRLRPDSLQKQILESIQSSQGILNFEHKLILASIHPSLFLKCKLLEKEESIVDKERLEKVRLDPHVGVKTKFLVEFVNLCNAVNEKVLVFSQFTAPLRLIIEQLNSIFNWAEGKEILYMDGKIDLKEKQSLIHNFNDANSKAKILLACTKACSEGISLVGASRIVLLDVVWNPSVERQAISRAYRIGQERVVYTYHLLMHGTAECVKYSKQAEKDRLSELVFSDNGKGKNRAVNFEDGILDRMLRHKKLKDMFVECVVQPKERDLVESYYY